jgi:hypothetical protein
METTMTDKVGHTAEVSHISSPPAATLFTAFGIGHSYIFHVGKGEPDRAEKCWEEVFSGYKGWSFKKLEKYDKPLGETVTFALNAESCACSTTAIKELHEAFATKLLAELDSKRIDIIFFTTGVAVLVLRLTPKDPENTMLFFDILQDEDKLVEVRKGLKKIIKLCKETYINILNAAERCKSGLSATPEWSLRKLREVDREGWEPRPRFSYPLFFVDKQTYQTRIEKILDQVAGSKQQVEQQSNEAKVSYRGTEIYVDWSESLVSETGNNQESIENNFIIALASWLALILMNKNSSFFLFEAFQGMATDKHQAAANAVHQRNMAYKDVADATIPIRWTTRRRDLFLLETIHHNWSSERWRGNIEERMKLLALHYKRIDDERQERFSKRLAIVAVSLTLLATVSALADFISLAENYNEPSHWTFLGYPLKKFGFYLSWVLLPAGILGAMYAWLEPFLRSRRNTGK